MCLFSSVDIDDDEEDLKRIVGREYAALYLQKDRKKWDMSKMFEHIVLERMVLDMSPRVNLQQQQLQGKLLSMSYLIFLLLTQT